MTAPENKTQPKSSVCRAPFGPSVMSEEGNQTGFLRKVAVATAALATAGLGFYQYRQMKKDTEDTALRRQSFVEGQRSNDLERCVTNAREKLTLSAAAPHMPAPAALSMSGSTRVSGSGGKVPALLTVYGPGAAEKPLNTPSLPSPQVLTPLVARKGPKNGAMKPSSSAPRPRRLMARGWMVPRRRMVGQLRRRCVLWMWHAAQEALRSI